MSAVFPAVVSSVGLCSEEVGAGSAQAHGRSRRRAGKAHGSFGRERRREAAAGAWDVLAALGTGGRSCSLLGSPVRATVVFALLSSRSPWGRQWLIIVLFFKKDMLSVKNLAMS